MVINTMDSYKKSGVNIDVGNTFVKKILTMASKTIKPDMINKIGGFSSLFSLPSNIKNPVLSTSCDGVGTKLKVAFMANKHNSAGIDLVAMNINDLICCGAKPLCFLDYIATGKLDLEIAQSIIEGIVEGCKISECALVGGETAEMPGFYADGEYDLAGFSIGVVDYEKIIDGSRCRSGDIVLGLHSSGLHSNGFSLARNILIKENTNIFEYVPCLGRNLAEELLEPTKIYYKQIKVLCDTIDVRSIIHITGGGLIENPPRSIPDGLAWKLYRSSWEVPNIMKLIQEEGDITTYEMFRTFNMGLGMLVVIPPEDKKIALSIIDEGISVVGEIVERKTYPVELA
jgi:phosphoribosylformylglycinamidine cyclo-ligase